MSRISRRKFLKASAAGGVASAGIAAPAIAQSMPELKWRCTSSFPKSLDTLYGSLEFFCKRVAEMTDNKFQIQPFAAGEIVPGLQAQDAVTNGTVEACQTASYYYWGKDPTFTFGTSLPFGFNPRGQHAWWYHGGGAEVMNEYFKKYNIYAIMFGNTGGQMGGFFRTELKNLDALKGLKMRIGGFAGIIVQKLGLVPQQLAAGDIYPALEKGTLDATEWVGPYDDEKLGFHKVAKYYYYPGWWEGSATGHLFINDKKWEELPKNYKSIVLAAAGEGHMWQHSKYDAVNPAALKRLLSAGVQLRQFPEDVLDASFKAANEIYADLAAKNPDFKKVYDHYRPQRSDWFTWYQITDYTYDTYMIIQNRKKLL